SRTRSPRSRKKPARSGETSMPALSLYRTRSANDGARKNIETRRRVSSRRLGREPRRSVSRREGLSYAEEAMENVGRRNRSRGEARLAHRVRRSEGAREAGCRCGIGSAAAEKAHHCL